MAGTPPQIRHGHISVNGLRLFLLRSGRSGPPLLCLHGRWGRARTWGDLMRRYGSQYRIVAPDQRGHGRSDQPPSGYAAEDLASDARAILERLGFAPAIVVGHSMGARVAAHLAALHPQVVSAVALLDETLRGTEALATAAPGGRRPDDDGLTSDWPAPWASRAAAIRFLEQRFPRRTSVEYFGHSLHKTPAGYDFLFSRASMAAIGRSYRDWRHLLPAIRCPVLLVRAAESWCLPAEEAQAMSSLLPDCTYVEIADSDHMVYTDSPQAFYSACDHWLSQVARRTP